MVEKTTLCLVERNEINNKTIKPFYGECNDAILMALHKTFMLQLRKKPVGSLGLSVRALNVCHKNNIMLVGELLEIPYNKVILLRGGGPRVLEEIYELLRELGFQCEQWNPRNYRRGYDQGIRKRLLGAN
jgi:DNA-directed RNA polymerase alpha subunit